MNIPAVKGTVLEIFPVIEKGGFRKKSILFKADAETDQSILIDFLFDDIEKLESLVSGDKIEVAFCIESRDWNGRYFTNIKANSVKKLGGVKPTQKKDEDEDESFVNPFSDGACEDDVPF